MFPKIFGFVVLVAPSTYFSFLVADIALRIVAEPARDTLGLFRADHERGHAMTPNFKAQITTSYKYFVSTNSRGYRDEEWSLEPRTRVIVLGDSFTFGEPLPVDQSFTAKATKRFRDSVRFYNLGVSGYGPAQEAVTLAKECPEIKPAHVFYMFYLNDTAWDNVRTNATTVVDGFVVHAITRDGLVPLTHEVLRAKVAAAVQQREFSLLALVTLKHLRDFALPRLKALFNSGGSPSKPQTLGPDYSSSDTRLAASEITKLAIIARQCGASFTMMILPSRWEAARAVVEPATNEVTKLLAEGSERIDIIDLRDRAKRGADIGLPKDDHYNPSATTWVADELAVALVSRHPDLSDKLIAAGSAK